MITTLNVDPDQYEKLAQIARTRGTSVSALFRAEIERYKRGEAKLHPVSKATRQTNVDLPPEDVQIIEAKAEEAGIRKGEALRQVLEGLSQRLTEETDTP